MERKTPTPKLEPLKDLGAEAGFNLLAVSTVPSDAEDRRLVATMVTENILSFFDSRLTPEDRALWRLDESEESWTEPNKKRIWGMLDQTIIERAQTLGWRVYLSPVVLLRMAKWHGGHEHGPQRLRQLGEAVVMAAQVARGEAKLPISELEWKQNKVYGVDELRRLFKQFRSVFNQRRTPASYQETCEWLLKTVNDSPKAFPFLSVNTISLFRYFEHAKQEDVGFAGRLVLGEIKPGLLFDEWGAWGRGLSPDTFRQSISELPAKKL